MPATIRLGDSGDDVKRLQRVFARIKVLGPSNISGQFDQSTDQAVREFQQTHGLGVDGIVGALTWSQLPPYREASPTLSPGAVGPVVAMLQQVLQTSFGYIGAIDGLYGPIT
jgi:peptidoglycan hydrolase-like protein with peptidoglycan-binding domain